MKKRTVLVVIVLVFLCCTVFADRNLIYDDMVKKVVLLFNRQGGLSLESWIGSGVIVSPDGYIVTNRHVAGYYLEPDGQDEYGQDKYKLAGNGADLLVYHSDWGYGGCRIVAVSLDPEKDLALIKVEAAEELLFAEIAYNENIGPGTTVYAVGHPLGIGWMMTKGVISTVIETERHNIIIIHDASINPGNSGGALYDEFGRVVGLNFAAIPPFAAENVAAAVDARMLVKFVRISIEFDQKRMFVMTEADYKSSYKRFFTLYLDF